MTFDDSLQHHDFFENGMGHVTYSRCESCMYGSHFETVTWHSWANEDDFGNDMAKRAELLASKCACDCAGPRGAQKHEESTTETETSNE